MATTRHVMDRIKKDYIIAIENLPNMEFNMDESNIYKWTFVVKDIPNSRYAGHSYRGTIDFPHTYPMCPPTIKFTDHVFHPNVYADGSICISILHSKPDETNYVNEKNMWAPCLTICKVMLSIISLFYDPNLESPANIDANKLWNNQEEFMKQL